MRPIVDGLEEELAPDLIVIRIDIQNPSSRSVMAEYGVYVTPTFLFFDGDGSLSWQSVGQLDVEKIRTAVHP